MLSNQIHETLGHQRRILHANADPSSKSSYIKWLKGWKSKNMFGMKEIRNKAEEKTNIDLEDSYGVLSIISKV